MSDTPNHICLEGLIGAGKTTIASKIAKALNGKLICEQFEDNPFLPLFYNNPTKYALRCELSFLAERYEQLMKEAVNLELFSDFRISDYHIIKCLVFARYNLDEKAYYFFKSVFDQMVRNLPTADKIIYLYVSPEKALENINKRGRSYEQGITVEYLSSIQEIYLNTLEGLTIPVQIIDYEKMGFVGEDIEAFLQTTGLKNELTSFE